MLHEVTEKANLKNIIKGKIDELFVSFGKFFLEYLLFCDKIF